MFLLNTMANPFDTTNNYSSPSSHAEPDEISLFLRQILLRSSSSSPSAFIRKQSQCSVLPCDHNVAENQEPEMGSFPGRIFVPGPCSGLNSSTGCWVPANVSSSYVGTFDNDPDEYDCESEEGVEVLAEEAAQKETAARNSSKRSRAAEVHNLSEKRRRSRINEKMKALQNLIPNSNKTDKVSMLDEAIEYLKQLQLQVQMLTLRNGLSLYPICLPGMLPPDHISHTRADICERSISLSTEKGITMEQDISADTLLNLQNNYVKQAPSVASFSTTLGSKTMLESQSSFQNHLEPIQFSRSCAGVCREEVLSCKQPNGICPTTLTGHFGTRPSNLKDHTIEAAFLAGGGSDKLPNLLHNTIFSSQLKKQLRQWSETIF